MRLRLRLARIALRLARSLRGNRVERLPVAYNINNFVLDCHVCWHHIKLTGMPDCLCDGGTTLRVSLRDV